MSLSECDGTIATGQEAHLYTAMASESSQYLKVGPELSTPAYDRHVVDTIKRLQCIKQLVADPQNFQAAGRELLEWCSDTRAFSPKFEPYLMECLELVRECAQQEGYDLQLSYRLLAICSANGDKFCQQSSALLSCWSEDLGRALLRRHGSISQTPAQDRSEIPVNSSTVEHTDYTMQPGMQQQQPQQPMLRKQYSTGDGSQMGWPMEAGPRPTAGPNGLSVVTTVWGMTPGTQAGPRHATLGYDTMPMYQRGATPASHIRAQASAPSTPGYAPQQPGFYRQNSMPSGPGPGMTAPYRPQYNPPPNGNPDYQPPPGALSAAAMVAAAATATATATATAATMLVHQDQQQPQYHRHPTPTVVQHPTQMGAQYGVQYGSRSAMRGQPAGAPMMISREMAAATGQMPGGGPIPSQQSSIVYRRPAPYGNHQQVLMHRKPQYSASMPVNPQYGAMAPQPTTYNPAEHAQYQAHMRHPSSMMAQASQPVTYNNGAPPPYAGAPPYTNQMSRTSLQSMPQQPLYQNGYMVPQTMQDVKPGTGLTGNDLFLTFPIRDGIILPPFRLEHNLSVTQLCFQLKEQVFQTLMERQDSEVQLKCYYHSDLHQSPNWPASVSISVNNRPLLIDRGAQDHKTSHKPLYLKNACVPGKNTITISVCACCCSHLFVLQVVHRPTVKSILHGLLKKRFLPAENCINKIKANFASTSADGVEQTSMKIFLKCPITFRRIMLPARGHECRHIQCFDLESYLQMNAERGLWRCPVCKKNALLEGLEIDQYMWGIIDQLSKTEVDEINIDANASWKPSMPMAIAKEEDTKDLCAVNSWMKVYSPSSTNLPSVGSYEVHHNNPMSPYPTPPNSHNSQGSNSIAHFNGGMYDVGFNSPPDFTGPMSNRSDMSENDKRLAVLQIQKSGIASPSQGPPSNAQVPAPTSNTYSNISTGGPASNAPVMLPTSGPASNMASGGPPSNAPMSQGPPSNAPASQGPPSNAPASHGGPASNAPVNNMSPASVANGATTTAGVPPVAELPADISELVNNVSSDNLSLEGFDDIDLLPYLGPQDLDSNNGNEIYSNTTSINAADDEIMALLVDS